MAELTGFLMVAGGFAAILGGFRWLALRIRDRGLGGAVMGPLDEVYHPSALRSRDEIAVHEEAGATAEGSSGTK